jgi:hypothetical protein
MSKLTCNAPIRGKAAANPFTAARSQQPRILQGRHDIPIMIIFLQLDVKAYHDRLLLNAHLHILQCKLNRFQVDGKQLTQFYT